MTTLSVRPLAGPLSNPLRARSGAQQETASIELRRWLWPESRTRRCSDPISIAIPPQR